MVSRRILNIGDATIQLPLEIGSVYSFYVFDGGTYGVRFIDGAGTHHTIGSWQPLGLPERHGEIITGGITPDAGGKNIGRVPLAEQFIFSAMELEDENARLKYRIMDKAYPTIGSLVTHARREFLDQ